MILGFNCFTDVVGPCCERAPEHSDSFNRTVKLYQALASSTGRGRGYNSPKSGSSGGDQDDGHFIPTASTQTTNAPPQKGDSITRAAERDTQITCQNRELPRSRGVSAKDILKKPALAKLLVAAARRVKKYEAETGTSYQSTG